MTWTEFTMAIALVYLTYYGLNVLFDMFRARGEPSAEAENDVLFFEESTPPELITYEGSEPEGEPASPVITGGGTQSISSGLIQATGAVGLKQLFNLAKDDLIEYTRAIPY